MTKITAAKEISEEISVHSDTDLNDMHTHKWRQVWISGLILPCDHFVTFDIIQAMIYVLPFLILYECLDSDWRTQNVATTLTAMFVQSKGRGLETACCIIIKTAKCTNAHAVSNLYATPIRPPTYVRTSPVPTRTPPRAP